MKTLNEKSANSLNGPFVAATNATLDSNKNLLEKYKAEVLRTYPTAKIKYEHGVPHVFVNNKDLSTDNFMPVPKNEEQAWFQANKSVDFQKAFSIPIPWIFSDLHYTNTTTELMVENNKQSIVNHC
tara:strand:+ start:541 stop:918 length:378 start_codon:yes stop_codon:yes gene_type:complete